MCAPIQCAHSARLRTSTSPSRRRWRATVVGWPWAQEYVKPRDLGHPSKRNTSMIAKIAPMAVRKSIGTRQCAITSRTAPMVTLNATVIAHWAAIPTSPPTQARLLSANPTAYVPNSRPKITLWVCTIAAKRGACGLVACGRGALRLFRLLY